MRALETLPILDKGRVKPLTTFAKSQRKYFAGTDHNALIWLRDLILNPALSETLPTIKITNPDALNLLGLTRSPNKLYAYRDLTAALQRNRQTLETIENLDQKQWTNAQADVMDIRKKTIDLADMMASLSLFLPLAAHIPDIDDLNDDMVLPDFLAPYAGQSLTYWQGVKFQVPLKKSVAALAHNKGSDIAQYDPLEQMLVHLAFSLDNLQINGQLSQSFRVIPIPQNGSTDPWLTPWQVLEQGAGSPEHAKLLQAWRNLAMAYHTGQPTLWDQAASSIYDDTLRLGKTITGPAAIRIHALSIENVIAHLNPLKLGTALYALALFILGGRVAVARLRQISPSTSARMVAFAATGLALLVQTAFVIARIYILQRPPVSTLFESILFVGVVSVGLALWFARTRSGDFWLISAAALGFVMMVLAQSHAQDGDSMMMLSAVLNTNFWLATHVMCIMMGYVFA